MIKILGYQDKCSNQDIIVNTTTRSTGFGRNLSPMLLGPIETPFGTSKNFENFWQFSKVYPIHLDNGTFDGNILSSYFEWRNKGFNYKFAHRYPMGKGAIPLFSLLGEKKLSYIDARKEIYLKYYKENIIKTHAYQELLNKYKESIEKNVDLVLIDFDAYDHRNLGYDYNNVINDPRRKMGHAFVLGMLLDGFLK
jgi:hypothetical protein